MAEPVVPGTGPVYVGGLDRSGKTTMAAFLSSHPDIAIPAVGSNMWTYFYGQYGDLRRPQNFERCLDALLHYKHVRFLDPDPQRIRREFAAGPPTYARLFALFLTHYAERAGKPRWGAQTGLIERYAERLFAAYPGLRIVHMLRDPRDRYEASLARWPDGRGRAGGAVARWRYSLALAERHARRHPDAYLIVRFEDLVTDTEATLRRVCRFLDAPFTATMLDMHGAPKLRRTLQGEGERQRALLSPDYIGGYRHGVQPAELAFIQVHLGRRMRAHGYLTDPDLLSSTERVRFALTVVPDQTVRMVTWRAVEELQQRFPRWIRRRPGARMIVNGPLEVAT
ncbi:MAG TPA: sulfotransferase [Euzebyales bacterium]|nr:sulfotransferase [Euzebyales bacterium]